MPDHADRAVAAAFGMRRALASFNEAETTERLPNLESGIGIATGPAVAGNIGGRERIEYTVMGDAVNLAARLEDRTKDAGAPILVSAETYAALDRLRDVRAKALAEMRVKGRRAPVTVYALSG
ncbi:adenylate/guanylate cyclase domain-containing protein [Agromyces arachidis]|uniref:adenylate/guanylate cyclase domain-containing protein n=1 Tax=Agromyces arachidis TaxID=766966 RepID=UPI004057396D